MKYIELNRNKKSFETKVIVQTDEIFSDKNLEDLSALFGVAGDEGDLVFLGSSERVEKSISMYGYLHKNKACADIYNEKVVIINRNETEYYSLSDEQIRYFENIYKKYPNIENMPGARKDFVNN